MSGAYSLCISDEVFWTEDLIEETKKGLQDSYTILTLIEEDMSAQLNSSLPNLVRNFLSTKQYFVSLKRNFASKKQNFVLMTRQKVTQSYMIIFRLPEFLNIIKIKSIRKSSNSHFQWIKTLYQNI